MLNSDPLFIWDDGVILPNYRFRTSEETYDLDSFLQSIPEGRNVFFLLVTHTEIGKPPIETCCLDPSTCLMEHQASPWRVEYVAAGGLIDRRDGIWRSGETELFPSMFHNHRCRLCVLPDPLKGLDALHDSFSHASGFGVALESTFSALTHASPQNV